MIVVAANRAVCSRLSVGTMRLYVSTHSERELTHVTHSNKSSYSSIPNIHHPFSCSLPSHLLHYRQLSKDRVIKQNLTLLKFK